MSDEAQAFWRHFAAASFGREPVDVADPGVGLAIDPGQMFQQLLRACEVRDQGPKPTHVRFHIGQRQIFTDLDQYLPDRSDRSLDGYLARLDNQLAGQPYLLAVERLQASNRWIWKRAAEFLAGLYEATGTLPARVDVEAFVGRYPHTVPGLHRERSGVFVCMTQGRKQMLVWPPAAAGLPSATAHYEQARASARVLSCEPGRLVYWPGMHWHVGECPDQATAGLHVAVLERPPEVQDLLSGATGGIAGDLADGGLLTWPGMAAKAAGLPRHYDQAAGAITDVFGARDTVREMFMADWLRRLTGLGFTAVPPRYPEFALTESQTVARDSVYPIMLVGRDGATNWCAADGRLGYLRSSPALTTLIDWLNAGQPVAVQAALRLADCAEDRDLLMQTMCMLAAWRALAVTD